MDYKKMLCNRQNNEEAPEFNTRDSVGIRYRIPMETKSTFAYFSFPLKKHQNSFVY